MSVLDEAPPEVKKYSGKEYSEIPTDALIKLREFHYKCSKSLADILAKDHEKIVKEIDDELKRRFVLEKYFKNTIRALLKEAVKRGLINEDMFISELLKD